MANNESVLYDSTAACRKSLVECIKAYRLMEDKWATLRLADFNIWAAVIGPPARHNTSLDGYD